MPPNLSVIVPTCQRRVWAERLLRALSQQTLAPQVYEVSIERDFSAASMIQQVTAICAESPARHGEKYDRAH